MMKNINSIYFEITKVNALFFKPSEQVEASAAEAAASWLSHAAAIGRAPHPAYAEAVTSYFGLCEGRKSGLGGVWFAVAGETQADAFLRRLKADDPAKPVYEQYVAEMKARWAESGKELSAADAEKAIVAVEAAAAAQAASAEAGLSLSPDGVFTFAGSGAH